MKKLLFIIVMVMLSYAGVGQENINPDIVEMTKKEDISKFRAIIRFKPLATLVSLLVYPALDLELVVVPYLHPKIGIPVEIQFAYMKGIFGVAFLTGIEATPITHKEKSGLYVNLEGGFVTAGGLIGFCATSNIGYQLVNKHGFVFTPAAGIKYDQITNKLMPNLMLDIGIAF